MNKLKFVIGLCFIALSVCAQQDPQYTQYTYNMNLLNPAYSSTKERMVVTALGRSQWVGIEGAPKTLTFSFTTPLKKKLGMGFSVLHDQVGPAKETNVYVDFSYNLRLSENSNLAVGLKGGVTFLNVNGFEFSNDTPDPLNVPINLTAPNFGFGLFYYQLDRFYVGLSVPNVLASRYLETVGNTPTTSEEVKHFFLTGGYVFELSKDIVLKPSTLFKVADGTNLSIDLSANLFVNDVFEFGLSHRWDESRSESISGLLAFNLNNELRVGASMDYSLSRFQNFNSGTYEIMFQYTFGGRIFDKSPRYF